jgi:FkbM family methyltransferase
MLQKIKRKIILLTKIWSIGAGLPSKLTLLLEFARLSYRRYTSPQERPYSCRVQVEGRTARVFFTGTMGELLTLVDIFADYNYAPRHQLSNLPFHGESPTLLDLGANIGLATVWFALSYPDLSIHAYEPSPRMFALLQKNVSQFPNVEAFEEAIAGSAGTVEFNQSQHSLESSIFSARDSASVTVQAVSLDTAINRMGRRVDLIKMDIEGAEFDALKNSQGLAGVRSIIGEAHTEQSGHPQAELSELLSAFDVLEIYNPNNDTVFGFYAARTTPLL